MIRAKRGEEFFWVNAMQELEPGSRQVLNKYARQAADLGAVYLYKEGLFVRAYNEGAYAFIHQVMACKPLRRFVKSIAGDRVVCGVPLTTLMTQPEVAQASQIDALIWRWPMSAPIEREMYEAWRETLPLILPNESAPKVDGGGAAQTVPDTAHRLIERLMLFNVAASTPMAAMNLVSDLQRQWQEREVV